MPKKPMTLKVRIPRRTDPRRGVGQERREETDMLSDGKRLLRPMTDTPSQARLGINIPEVRKRILAERRKPTAFWLPPRLETERDKHERWIRNGEPRACLTEMTGDEGFRFLAENIARLVAKGLLEQTFVYAHTGIPYAYDSDLLDSIVTFCHRERMISEHPPPIDAPSYLLYRGIAATGHKVRDAVWRYSWTDSLRLASQFASRNAAAGKGSPAVYAVEVPRKHVMAYINVRHENEYIVQLWRGARPRRLRAKELSASQSNGRCFSCDGILGDNSEHCPSCDNVVCPQCTSTCQGCGESGCRVCVNGCLTCGDLYCPSCCVCYETDAGTNRVCKGCLIDKVCPVCLDQNCKKHKTETAALLARMKVD